MKLQKNTLGILISAILLGIGVAAYEFSSKIPTTEIKTDKQPLVNFKEEEIQTLIIKDQRTTLEFQQTSNNKQPWKMVKPKQGIANDAVISFLTNLLINGESNRRFTVTNTELKNYGLDQPFATITIILKDNRQYQLKLGEFDFQNQFLYASLMGNQESSPPEVLLVSRDFQYALERDLEEWEESEIDSNSEAESE